MASVTDRERFIARPSRAANYCGTCDIYGNTSDCRDTKELRKLRRHSSKLDIKMSTQIAI